MTVPDEQTISLRGWPQGKNTVLPENELPPEVLREALNVDLTDSGKPRRRLGRTLRYSGADIHSLWSHGDLALFCENGQLKRLNPDWTAVTLGTGLIPTQPISYEFINGEVYWSNGTQTGKINRARQAGPWGVPLPASSPELTAVATGGMEAGTYQVAVTFLAADGEESGALPAKQITIAAGEGIQISSIPQGQANAVRIYATPVNGGTLYHQFDIPMGVTTSYLSGHAIGPQLETMHLKPMPAGQIVRYYNGRMWVADGDTLIASEPYRYGLHRPSVSFFSFSSRITVLQPVVDGLFVVADVAYFLAGGTPSDMQQREVDGAQGVEGTGLSVPAKYFSQEATGDWAYWVGRKGAVLGTPGGGVVPLTEGRLAGNEFETGASMVRERDGIRQLVTTLAETGRGSSLAASDNVVAEVRRNGITIT